MYSTSIFSTECIKVLMTQTDQFDFKDTPYYLEYNDSLIVDGFDTDDVFENNYVYLIKFK